MPTPYSDVAHLLRRAGFGGTPNQISALALHDLPALVDKGRRLMTANRGRWEQSTTGSLRNGEMHWVFERTGRPCRRCGTRIASAEQGTAPYARLSYWCPHCQRGPAPPPSPAPARRDRPLGRTRYKP